MMSLFNTIAHQKAAGTTVSAHSAMVVLALLAGTALGSVISGPVAGDDPNQNAIVGGGMAHEDFLRLNTIELEYPPPSRAVSAADAAPSVDPFVYWNTTAFDDLVPRQSPGGGGVVSEEFLEWNIESLEYPLATQPERPAGPR